MVVVAACNCCIIIFTPLTPPLKSPSVQTVNDWRFPKLTANRLRRRGVYQHGFPGLSISKMQGTVRKGEWVWQIEEEAMYTGRLESQVEARTTLRSLSETLQTPLRHLQRYTSSPALVPTRYTWLQRISTCIFSGYSFARGLLCTCVFLVVNGPIDFESQTVLILQNAK